MNRILANFAVLLLLLPVSGCNRASSSETMPKSRIQEEAAENSMDNALHKNGDQQAVFGAGCFWCVEAVFQRLNGVDKVVSGYAGGNTDHPTYEQVCTGTTGHAEVCQITFNPAKISYLELLEVFWKVHDPTTLNRQGNDAGTQYRSAVFYANEEQKKIAEEVKAKLTAAKIWDRPIVTEIVRLQKFWPAEAYHQNYFNNNPEKAYCALVINPKVEKFKKTFAELLRK
jgi:peptide-methionine (S)-S-oxide reductase